MNQLINRPENYAALPSERDPYEALGDAIDQNRIVGDLLKFNKGEWLAGQNEDDIPLGTKLIANMAEARIGWLKWADKKVVGSVMGRIGEGYLPPPRNSLGELDSSQWERGPQGEPQDPFALTATLVLKVPGEDKLFTFSTSSKGGIAALGKLCKSYGKQRGAHPAWLPIISLEADHYKHQTFGKVHVPNLPIVGWTDQAEMLDAIGAADEPDNGTAAILTRSPASAQLDDDIPF